MEKRPLNPFLTALFVLAGAGLLVGLLLVLVGYRLSESFDATTEDPSAGLAQLAIGSQLGALGFIALFIALAAAAVMWRPAVAERPDPALADSL
jgi:hypothetical protein